MPGTDIHTLARLPLLRGSNRRQLMHIARLTTAIDAPPERVLCEQGTLGQHFYIVLKGRAAVVRDGRLLALLGRGDWFGEMAFSTADQTRSATVKAVTSTTLLVFGRVGYRTLLETCPQAAARIAEREAARVATLASPAGAAGAAPVATLAG